ncbi:MAG: cytochrome c [candidate division NC10 bacterium]|nr:cytochrome c [candidate division NC10 bacterium]
MRGEGLRVVLFGGAVIAAYSLYANSIPQIESRPPEELTAETGALGPEALARAGERIFFGKGACSVCHTIGQAGGRGPDLMGVSARAAARKPGMSGAAYLVESLVNPTAFVVPGFPPIMPPANRPPVGLNRTELYAVVAYLQSLGGQVTVREADLPSAVAEAAAGGTGLAAAPPSTAPAAVLSGAGGDPAAGQAVFMARGCVACHMVGGAGGTLGPDLSRIGARRDPAALAEKILNPRAKPVEGFPPIMPENFAAQLTVKDLSDLVAYLGQQKGEAK